MSSLAAPAAAHQIREFWQQNAGALIALLGVLIATVFGFWQWRRSQQAQRELEAGRLEWESRKIEVEDRVARERIAWEEQRKEAARRAEAEEAMQARLREQAEHSDSMGRQAIAYRRALINELRNLKILDMSKPLDLEALYVQVQVREEESPRYTKDEEIAKLAHGDPEYLLRLSQMRLGERAALALAPEDALRRFNRIVVLGDPGAGKTTMLRHLAFRCAQGELSESMVLPIYVELRRFVDSELRDLLEFVTNEWHERYGFVEACPYIEGELDAGRSVLLLDGLDEVLGGDTAAAANAAYNRVADEIDRLANRFRNAPITVTCRRAGWQGKLPAFQTLEVLDFSWEQIQVFIKNWFVGFPAKSDGLCRALAGNLRMQTLAANPLILSLIAIVYERELELPERRAQLYNRCVDVLLKEWDAHREIRRFGQFTTDRKRDLLEEIAWHFHSRGLRYFPKSDLLNFIADFLPTIDLPSNDAEAILGEIAAHYGLLKVQAHEWYGFLHLTLQEYFVAVAANDRGPDALDEVIRHRHDPWWEEVILLLAGRMADATPLLERILGREIGEPPPYQNEPLAVDDDLFHSDLHLAARCLIGTPRIRSPWLREQILAQIRPLLRSARHSLDYRRAAKVLTEIDGEVLTSELLGIIGEDQVSVDRKIAIVEEFGRLGDATVAPRLLSYLQQADELEEPLWVNIAQALGTLRYVRALPEVLRKFEECAAGQTDMEDMEESRAYTCAGLARALGLMGDPAAIAPLMAAIRRFRDSDAFSVQDFISACLDALGILGDRTILPQLWEYLYNDKWFWAADSLTKTIGSLGGSEAAEELLAALLDDKIGRPYKPSIIKTLRTLKNSAILSSALRAIGDHERTWELRWMLTEVLESYPEAGPSLASMIEEPELDDRVRVGIATTLGTWGEPQGLPYLRGAITDDLLPSDLVLQTGPSSTFRFSGYFLPRVVAVLRRFDEKWIVPILITRFKSALLAEHDIMRDLDSSARAIAYSLAGDSPSEVGNAILDALQSQDSWNLNNYLSLLSVAISKPVVPTVIRTFKDNPRARREYAAVEVLRAVSRVGDDVDTAKRLFDLLPLVDSGRSDAPESSYDDAIYDGIFDICVRARVRAFADGEMRPVVSDN